MITLATTPLEVAQVAEAYLAKAITWDDFMKMANELWGDMKDEDAWGLIMEIEHEPVLVDKKGTPTPFGAEWLSNVNDHIASIEKRYS